ncbi:hypothetical protein Lal_00037987 [Lupinus albus]|nr:hypothetical protein Lal_00037987 [Lupinus albus]
MTNIVLYGGNGKDPRVGGGVGGISAVTKNPTQYSPRNNMCNCWHHNNVCGWEARMEGEDDPKVFPLVLDELLARTMVLRVKVQPSYNQSSLIRLSEDPNLIKKVLDQIGVFESMSITANHDPVHFQVVTPAMRLSAEFDLDLLQSLVYNSTQLSSSKMTKHMKME